MKKKKLPKTLITGADGMAGSYIDFGIKTNRKSLDVTDLKSVMRVIKHHKPRVIMHLAALTNLDVGENDPALTYMVNTLGTYNVALAAKEVGAKLVYISSIGVFDGTKKGPYSEDDVPNPQNYYGHSKYAGELIVQGMLEDYIIARSSWMFGGGPIRDKKFVAKMIANLNDENVKVIKAHNDVSGSPTFGKDLIEAIKQLIIENKSGLFHLTNSGSCSRLDVSKHIVDMIKPSMKVVHVDSNYFKLPARRVKNESSESKIMKLRDWKDALTEYIETEWKKKPETVKKPKKTKRKK